MKLLVFQHVPHEHPGLISTYAKENNISLHTIELWKKYSIPSLSNFDGLIIMGGPMGVYEGKETYPSKEDEIKTIKEGIGNIPMLGFCLGSQLMAYALGADVHPNIKNGKKVKEIGYYNIDVTSEGKQNPIFKDFTSPMEVLEWHGDAFELPKDSTLLATSPLCTNQAFSYKNASGLLFHFEFTPEMISKQIETDKQWIHQDFKLNEEKLIWQAQAKQNHMKTQSSRLLRNFISIILSRQITY